MELVIFKDGTSKHYTETEMSKGMSWNDEMNAYVTHKFGKTFKWHRDAWFEM